MGDWALKILEPDEARERPLFDKIWPTVLGGVLGFGSICYTNWSGRRPVFSGIQRHILAAGGLIAVFHYFADRRMEYYAKRDAVYRHYITLHREDFPDPERKQYKDLFGSWVPIR